MKNPTNNSCIHYWIHLYSSEINSKENNENEERKKNTRQVKSIHQLAFDNIKVTYRFIFGMTEETIISSSFLPRQTCNYEFLFLINSLFEMQMVFICDK